MVTGSMDQQGQYSVELPVHYVVSLLASSLLALLDDIATLLDDVSLMSKVAAKKTAGVLGDDLALNAQQVTGVKADRELPVVWAVMKGSFRNKFILVPGALLISAFIPWLITPLLMLGGAFLCYEGFEKLAHRFLHDDSERRAQKLEALADPSRDMVAYENTAEHTVDLPWVGSILGGLLPTLMSAGVGILAGALIFGVITLGGKLFNRRAAH